MMDTMTYGKMARRSLLITLLCAASSPVWAAGVLQPVDPAVQNVQTNGLDQRKQMVIEDEKMVRQQKLHGELSLIHI